MKKYMYALALIVALGALGVWLSTFNKTEPTPAPSEEEASASSTMTVVYACDEGRTISATFIEGEEAPAPAEGEMPQPTGMVEVSLDGGESTTLHQTVSADGVRFANEDESFVFWNKGDEALIMRNNAMDLDYTNCREQA